MSAAAAQVALFVLAFSAGSDLGVAEASKISLHRWVVQADGCDEDHKCCGKAEDAADAYCVHSAAIRVAWFHKVLRLGRGSKGDCGKFFVEPRGGDKGDWAARAACTPLSATYLARRTESGTRFLRYVEAGNAPVLQPGGPQVARVSETAGGQRLSTEVEEFHQLLEDESSKTVAKDGEIQRLVQELEKKGGEVRRANAKVAELRQQLEAEVNRTGAKDGEIQRLRLELEEKGGEARRANAKVAELRQLLGAEVNRTGAKDGEIRRLVLELEEKGGEVRRANAAVAEFRQLLGAEVNRMGAKDGEIQRLKLELAEKGGEAQSVGAEVAELRQLLEEALNSTGAKDGEIRRLAHELEKKEEEVQLLEEMLHKLDAELGTIWEATKNQGLIAGQAGGQERITQDQEEDA